MVGNRECGVCRTLFPRSGRKLYCSPTCAKQKQVEQLREGSERRKARALARPPKTCVSCKQPFEALHASIIYCSNPCRAAGLLAAIERQQERRKISAASHV